MLGRSLVALAAALVALGVAGAAPAAAHVELAASDPAAGTVLTAPPPSLSLTFSTTPVTVGVDVRGPDGRPVAAGPLERQGATVVVPLPRLEQPGRYTVAWRAANDAHPFTGEYTITLELPTTTTTVPATTTTQVAATVPARSSGESDGGGSRSAVVVIGAIGVALAGAVLLAARVRRARSAPRPG